MYVQNDNFPAFCHFKSFIFHFYLKTGGWSILLSMLDIDKKQEQQGCAALAIGTALTEDFMYDDYDSFQLWLLESDETHPSELILKKTYDIKDKNYDENENEFENKIDDDGKNDLTGKLDTGIGEDFSIDNDNDNDNDNHDIQNQNNNNNDDKSKNNNYNDINNDDKINDKSDKQNDYDTENNELSRIFVTKNQAISSTENQNNSNVNYNNNNISNNNNKNENTQKSMTGIEKLVSLLYHSTNNESFIMQNRPNLDELQIKVLYAIFAAYRNVDVQERLFRIKKSDLSFIQNGDMNKNESSSVGGKINIDQSILMNYLIKVAEQSNRNNSNNNNNDINNDNNNNDNDNNNNDNVSYELTNKIWTFIAYILNERAYTGCDLSLLKVFFLTEFWFNLAGKTFERFFHLYTIEIEKKENLNFESNVNDEIMDENTVSENTENAVSTDLNHGTLRSILENILEVAIVIISRNEVLKLKLKDEYKKSSNTFLMTLNVVSNLKGSESGKLWSRSIPLLKILA